MMGRYFYNRWFVYMLLGVVFFVPQLTGAQSSTTFPVQVQYGEDTEPPTVPQNLTATPVASTQIDLNWDASTDNFGVAGYQIFRDLFQIATTSDTEYVDTGLQASTTYSYTVAAFDAAGNTSSLSDSVATTTFALPPAPDPEDPDGVPRASGSAPLPQLTDFSLVVGSEVVRLVFSTNVPTSYALRYGQTEAGADGSFESTVFRRNHQTVITDLEPGTTYQYQLFVTDRYGQEVLVREARFTTEPRFDISMPSNVRSFSALVFASDVLLRWELPPDSEVAYVRVVRNPRFFPADPLDGTVVYEGTASSFTDTGAMQGRDVQYYTIFTYNLAGIPSSGVIAQAERRAVVPIEPGVVPDLDPTVPTTTPADPSITLQLRDIEFIQRDIVRSLADDMVSIEAEATVLIRVPRSTVPTKTRMVAITMWRPDTEQPPLSFLLQPSSDGVYYQAVLPGLAVTGTYDVQLDLFDGINDRFFTLSGLIEVVAAEPTTPVVQDEPLLVGIGYLLLGGVIGLLLALGLYWLLVWLWRWWFVYRWNQKRE